MTKIRCIEYTLCIYIYRHTYDYITYVDVHTHTHDRISQFLSSLCFSGEAKSCTVSWCQMLSAATLRTSLLVAWGQRANPRSLTNICRSCGIRLRPAPLLKNLEIGFFLFIHWKRVCQSQVEKTLFAMKLSRKKEDSRLIV